MGLELLALENAVDALVGDPGGSSQASGGPVRRIRSGLRSNESNDLLHSRRRNRLLSTGTRCITLDTVLTTRHTRMAVGGPPITNQQQKRIPATPPAHKSKPTRQGQQARAATATDHHSHQDTTHHGTTATQNPTPTHNAHKTSPTPSDDHHDDTNQQHDDHHQAKTHAGNHDDLQNQTAPCTTARTKATDQHDPNPKTSLVILRRKTRGLSTANEERPRAFAGDKPSDETTPKTKRRRTPPSNRSTNPTPTNSPPGRTTAPPVTRTTHIANQPLAERHPAGTSANMLLA